MPKKPKKKASSAARTKKATGSAKHSSGRSRKAIRTSSTLSGLMLCSFVAFFIILLGYFYIDSKVATALLSGRASGVPVVLGEANEPDSKAPPIIATLSGDALEARKQKSLQQLPQHLIQAVLSTEDERFYSHHGIDLIGIARAMLVNLRAMRWVQGGSTITQQLAKNLVLSPRKTLGRKLQEMLAAFSLERRLSKDQILERYLNEVYLGQEGAVAIHGVGEAAQVFFSKEVEELSLSEAATLAGIIKAPSFYSPRRHLERALDRREVVLSRMLETGAITADQSKRAEREKLLINAEAKYQKSAPYFVVALRKELEEDLDLESADGLTVQTGVMPELQRCAESALSSGIEKLRKANPRLEQSLQGGLVALEPQSGKVRAWVGGSAYQENQFDHVSQARRQIGSTIKPFVYLTALDRSLNNYRVANAMSIVSDEPLSVDIPGREDWEPENYDRDFRGDVTFRFALERSLNLPAVYVSQRVGIARVASTLRAFRVGENIQAVPALALGALDTTLLDLTAAYGALANGGVWVRPRLYTKVLDSQGHPLLSQELFEEPVANEDATYVLTNMLQGVIERGTATIVRKLGFNAAAAGKTGTSNDTRDAWFIGYTPDLVAGVWVGRDDNAKTGLTGGVAAAPIWAEFMNCSAAYSEPLSFVPPPGVMFTDVDVQSGGLATPACPAENIVREVFVKGTQPTRRCKLHQRYDEHENAPDYRDAERPKRERKGLWDLLFGN